MAKDDLKSIDKELAALKRANEALRLENAGLKARLDVNRKGFWRKSGIVICTILATLALMVGNVLFWAGDTLVNNERYTEAVTPVLEDSAVQAALANYTTLKIFQNVDVQQTIQEVLPPRADFLAPTLATQVQNGTEQTLKRVVASDKFQTTWTEVNSRAHERAIASIKNSNGDGVLNLQEVYQRVSDSLQGTKLSFLADKELPSKVGSIEVVSAEWVPTARTAINSVSWIKPVSLLVAALFGALAIWLTGNRRRIIIILGGSVAAGMALSLIIFQLAQSSIVSRFAPAYQTAADHTTSIITGGLITQTVTILLVGLVIAFTAWLTGPYHTAITARQRINWLISGRLHHALFGTGETGFTRWVGRYRRPLQWGAVAGVSVTMLLVRLSPKLVLLYALLLVIIVLFIELMAAYPEKNE